MSTQPTKIQISAAEMHWAEFEIAQKAYVRATESDVASRGERVRLAVAAQEAHRRFVASLSGDDLDRAARDRLDHALEAITFAHSALLTIERAGLFDERTDELARAGTVLLHAAHDRLSDVLKREEC